LFLVNQKNEKSAPNGELVLSSRTTRTIRSDRFSGIATHSAQFRVVQCTAEKHYSTASQILST